MSQARIRFARRAGAMLVLALVAVVGLALTARANLGTFDPAVFELDGNATDPTPPLGDDWETTLTSGGDSGATTGLLEDIVNGHNLASTFPAHECDVGVTTCDDVATGGSTKDDIDFDEWLWHYQTPNDKTDIEHAFAALYTDPADDHVWVVFGMDRFNTNGSAAVGFWFTQEDIATTEPVGSADGEFTGNHVNEDILIQSDFTSGGSTSRVEVFEWDDDAGGPSSHPDLESRAIAVNADCDNAPVTATFCAIANKAAVPAEWDYIQKSGGPLGAATSTTIAKAGFFEGALDLTARFPGGIPCFSTFIAETRTSNPETSVLEDFIIGDFDLCSANISISPNDVNEVGQSHTFTVHVTANAGTGSGSQPVAGVVPVITFPDGAPETVDTSDCDAGTDASGNCDVIVNSSTATTISAHAAAEVPVGDTTISVETDGEGGNSGDATKRWVDAKISIAPDAVNAVGEAHTFTVTVQQDDGLLAADGGDGVTGFTAATVGNVDVTLTDSNGAVSVLNGTLSSCDDGQPSADNLDASGQCVVVFTSNSAGIVTGHASVTLVVDGETLTRQTNGVGNNSDDAVKRFVDARIMITPQTATNPIGSNHTLTGTFQKDDGLAAGAPGGDAVSGWAPVPDGTTLAFSLSANTAGATFVSGSTCTTTGGSCTVQITSNTAGSVDIDVSGSITVDGETLTRDTSPTTTAIPAGCSAPECDTANKVFDDGEFRIQKLVDGSSQLGSLSFQFRVQFCGNDSDCDPAPSGEITGSPFTVDSATNPLVIDGLEPGYYLVTEINIPSGFEPDVNPQIVQVLIGSDCPDCITLTFDNIPTERQGPFHTQTSCNDFINGTGLPIVDGDITYGVKQGKINNVSPGVFFFYATYTISGSPDSISVDLAQWFDADESDDDFTSEVKVDPSFAASNDFVVQNNQAFLYRVVNGACQTVAQGTNTTGQVLINYDPAGTVANGTYVLGVKYTPNASLIGTVPCHGEGVSAACRYWFVPSLNGTPLEDRSESILLRRR